MIDIQTLQQMHPKEHRQTNRDDLGPDVLSQLNPPMGDEFILCLPPTIIGFNMQKKEWGMAHKKRTDSFKILTWFKI